MTAVRDAVDLVSPPPADVLRDLLGGAPAERVEGVRQIKPPHVYRLELAGAPPRSVVLKRLDPAVARRARLAAERWLPALGLGERCPRLLGVAAERTGDAIWHLYEDLGDDTLAARPDPERVAATVDLVAELHTRAARHPVLPDARRHGASRGLSYFTESVGDAVAALETLAVSGIETPRQYAGVAQGLLLRLVDLQADVARRAQIFADSAGPDTLLHGDPWPINAFVHAAPEGGGPARARLVDWDKVAVGPFSHDLSALLFRFPPKERPRILERYRRAVARAGWTWPAASALDVLFDTAERARCANWLAWPVLALLEERAAWAFPALAEIERWFMTLDCGRETRAL